jgi:aerobic-type carbon monoxide dehydrogenase small subunit (CoxS/CutS family)
MAKTTVNVNGQDYDAPTDEEIRQGMAGHLCRCGIYTRIFATVTTAASSEGD